MFANPFPSSKPDIPRSVPKWVTYMVTRLGTEYGTGSSNFPDCFVSVIPFLLASLAYHRKWIESNFEPTHPIFLSRVWTSGILVRLELLVEFVCSRNAKSGMVASGIPANIVMANRLFNVELKLSEL